MLVTLCPHANVHRLTLRGQTVLVGPLFHLPLISLGITICCDPWSGGWGPGPGSPQHHHQGQGQSTQQQNQAQAQQRIDQYSRMVQASGWRVPSMGGSW